MTKNALSWGKVHGNMLWSPNKCNYLKGWPNCTQQIHGNKLQGVTMPSGERWKTSASWV